MKINLIVPIVNNFKQAIEMIDSIKTIHQINIHILAQWRELKPLSQAWNEGISSSQGYDYVLSVNDDILFSPHTIDALISGLEITGGAMVTGCNVKGEYPNPFDILNAPQKELSFSEHPDFSCFMVRPNFLEEFGKFDENFRPAYFEDNDMHRRIQLLGKAAYSSTRAFYYHYGSQTRINGMENYSDLNFNDNQGYYVKKWGGAVGTETYTTPYNDPSLTPRDWILDARA